MFRMMLIVGKKLKKLFVILAGFGDEGIVAAHTDVSVDGFQDTADGDRGIFLSRQQDMGSHGGCGSLSVGSGYGDGGLVVGHELAQEIGSGHHGDALFHSGFIFGIVRMDGCGVDHEVRTVLNVVCALTVINRGAAAGQKVGQGGLFGIRTGYGEMGCQRISARPLMLIPPMPMKWT